MEFYVAMKVHAYGVHVMYIHNEPCQYVVYELAPIPIIAVHAEIDLGLEYR